MKKYRKDREIIKLEIDLFSVIKKYKKLSVFDIIYALSNTIAGISGRCNDEQY